MAIWGGRWGYVIVAAMRLFEEVAKLEAVGAKAALCTLVEAVGSVPQRPGAKMVVREDGSISGTVGGGALEHRVIAAAGEVIETGRPTLVRYDTVRDLGMACGGQTAVFIDPLRAHADLVVFGAGHIGRDLCAMASRCGFRVTVVDERSEWATADAFPDASQVVAGDPVSRMGELPLSEDAYLVLVSHSHAVDQRLLGHLLDRPWRYLGMIASRRKARTIFAELEKGGADPAALARVHSPIGLKIGGSDPGEIAVSILAELVRVRHDKPEDPATSFRPSQGA